MTFVERPTILIVDDDPEITSALARGLQLHGYATISENSVDGALARFREAQVSAAIVDMMIGENSGIMLVKAARSEGNCQPILMLGALGDVEDRALGLDAGADDYIVKPFSFDRLMARLKVQVRGPDDHEGPASFLDAETRIVRSSGGQVTLTKREFSLLEMLATHPGTVLSRGDIFDSLWASEGTSSENVVDVYIGYLRKKLGSIPDFGFEINTIRNRGFHLAKSDAS